MGWRQLLTVEEQSNEGPGAVAWQLFGVGTAPARSTEWAADGASSVKTTATGAGAFGFLSARPIPVEAGGRYRCTLTLRGVFATAGIVYTYFRLLDSVGAVVVDSVSYTTVSGDATFRVVCEFDKAPATSVSAQVIPFRSSGITAGDTLYLDAISVEVWEEPVETPGTMGTILDGIRARLDTIDGLRTTPFVPGSVSPPAAYVHIPEDVAYDAAAADGCHMWNVAVTVVVSRATEQAYRTQLDGFVSPIGPKSIKAAIEGDDTLGGAVDSLRVERARLGVVAIGGIEYWAASFDVQVLG